MAVLLSPEMLKFLQDYPMLERRARFNNCDGPYVVNSEAPMSDAALIKHYNSTKGKK